MSDPMQEIMASFFIECEELHEALIDALQSMADGDHDDEVINVAFRAVHSIKGGAGAFGLDELVGFAHQFETVMDACRAHTLSISDELVQLFLRCGDFLFDLIRCSRDGEDIDQAASEKLIAELATWVESDEPAPEEPEIDFQPMTLDLGDLGGDATGLPDLPDLSELPDLPPLDLPASDSEVTESKGLRIVFRPDPELYTSGNEPLYLFRSLADLGPCRYDVEFAQPESFDDLSMIGGRITWRVDV